MITDKPLYLHQGGFNLRDTSKADLDFFIITSDFKNNYGYIGKKGKTTWKLYTILGRTPMVLGGKENHYLFKSFEECVAHLEKLSGKKIEIRYIEISNDIPENSIDIRKIGDSEIYGSEKTLDQLFASKKWTLTPGAEYKLELYIEYLKMPEKLKWTDFVINGMTFHLLSERHEQRIKDLEQQLEEEKNIIRPEDIPDFDI